MTSMKLNLLRRCKEKMNYNESPLELENRRRIYKLVEKFPGIHFRELFRKSNISMGSLEYHLNVLEKSDLIYLKKEGHYTRYFLKGNLGEEDKVLATMLRNDKLRRLLLTLVLNPGLSHKTLSNNLNWAKSTTSFYLKKLVDKNIVEERKTEQDAIPKETGKPQSRLYVNRPDKIVRLMVVYKSGFFDELSNRVLDLVEVL